MPALVKSRVASPPGTSEEEGTKVWPLLIKKSINCCRISAPVNFLVIQTPVKSQSCHWLAIIPKIQAVLTRGRLKVHNYQIHQEKILSVQSIQNLSGGETMPQTTRPRQTVRDSY